MSTKLDKTVLMLTKTGSSQLMHVSFFHRAPRCHPSHMSSMASSTNAISRHITTTGRLFGPAPTWSPTSSTWGFAECDDSTCTSRQAAIAVRLVAVPLPNAHNYVEVFTDFATAVSFPSGAVKTGQSSVTVNNEVWVVHHSPTVTARDDLAESSRRHKYFVKHNIEAVVERETWGYMGFSRRIHDANYHATMRRDVIFLARTGRLPADSLGMAVWAGKVVQGGARYNGQCPSTNDDYYSPDTPVLETHDGPIPFIVGSLEELLEFATYRDGASAHYQCNFNALSIQQAIAVCKAIVAEMRLPPYHGKNLCDALNKLVTQVLVQLMNIGTPVHPSGLALVIALATHSLTSGHSSGLCKVWREWTKGARWNVVTSYVFIYYPTDGISEMLCRTDEKLSGISKLYFFTTVPSHLEGLRVRVFFCTCDKCLNRNYVDCQLKTKMGWATVRPPLKVRALPRVTRGAAAHAHAGAGDDDSTAALGVASPPATTAASTVPADAASGKRARKEPSSVALTYRELARLQFDPFMDVLESGTVIAPDESFFLGFTADDASRALDEAGSYGMGNFYEKGWRVTQFRWFVFAGKAKNGDFVYQPWQQSPNVVVYTGTAIIRKALKYLDSDHFAVDKTLKGKQKGYWRLKRDAEANIVKYCIDTETA
jgi:hypothetical protein